MIYMHATRAERAEAERLSADDIIANGNRIHDLTVSCYTAAHGEDGRPEDVHERRLSDGSCRCGQNGPRA